MIKKKILLVALLTIPTSVLLIAEGPDITTTINDGNAISETKAQNNTSFNTNPEVSEVTLDQRFLCAQEGKEGGVICQMYECINKDCQTATITKNNSYESLNNTTSTNEKPQLIIENLDVPSYYNVEIRELENEIKSAEKRCERAESDPREKAICEAASAKVQWRKEKIKALEENIAR